MRTTVPVAISDIVTAPALSPADAAAHRAASYVIDTSAEARTALTLIGAPAAVRILSAVRVGTGLIVATEHIGRDYRYAVDTFRLPTPAETDPELADWARRTPGRWLLIDQAGAHLATDVPAMIREAADYLAQCGITDASKER